MDSSQSTVKTKSGRSSSNSAQLMRSLPIVPSQIRKRENNFDTTDNPNLGKLAITPKSGSHIPFLQATLKNLFNPPPTIVSQPTFNKEQSSTFYANSLNNFEMLKCANQYERLISSQCTQRQVRSLQPIFRARNNNKNIKEFRTMSNGLEREVKHNPLMFTTEIPAGLFNFHGSAKLAQLETLSRSRLEHEEMQMKSQSRK